MTRSGVGTTPLLAARLPHRPRRSLSIPARSERPERFAFGASSSKRDLPGYCSFLLGSGPVHRSTVLMVVSRRNKSRINRAIRTRLASLLLRYPVTPCAAAAEKREETGCYWWNWGEPCVAVTAWPGKICLLRYIRGEFVLPRTRVARGKPASQGGTTSVASGILEHAAKIWSLGWIGEGAEQRFLGADHEISRAEGPKGKKRGNVALAGARPVLAGPCFAWLMLGKPRPGSWGEIFLLALPFLNRAGRTACFSFHLRRVSSCSSQPVD